MAGTHDDAMLIVELSKFGAMIGVPEAAGRIFADDFDPQTAKATEPPVSTVIGFFETISTLVKHGLLNGELVRDWVYVAGVWKHVGPAVIRMRKATGAAVLYENFEAFATDKIG
jgi:hypothetical protein